MHAEERGLSKSPLEVSLVGTAGVAVVISCAFYAGVVAPLKHTWFGQLFSARGLTPYGIVALSVWSLVMILARFLRVRREQRVLSGAVDLLPTSIADRISEVNANVFVTHIANAEAGRVRGMLSGRVAHALESLRVRGRTQDVAEHLAHEANAALTRFESGYAMVRLCIWAIPILGFIGTVSGIGDAIGAFDEKLGAAAKLDEVRSSLGAVTAGLALAFETTLVALVTSVIVMFPYGAVQRYESAFLLAVEDYCARRLLPRIDDGDSSHTVRRLNELSRSFDQLQAFLRKATPDADVG